MDVTVHPGLGGRRRIGPDEAGVAVRQVEGEEMRRLLDPADEHAGLAEIGLRVARRMVQRHEHLPAAPAMLADVVLHDGVAADEPVLVPQPLEHPLGGVALLGALPEIVPQPLLDDLGEPVQLRPPDLGASPIPRRNREANIFRTLSREIPKCLAASRWLMPSAQARRTFRYSSTVKMPPPSPPPERAKVADFYAARSATITPLPWSTFAPPFPAGRDSDALRRPEVQWEPDLTPILRPG